MILRLLLGFLVIVLNEPHSVGGNDVHQQLEEIKASFNVNTDLIRSEEDSLLVLSTLDGSLIGISPQNGEVRWNIKNEPAVKVPLDTKNAISPLLLPDPKDGSLYLLKSGDTSALKKLPFSIKQLVAASPCKSSDGIFYTGKKVDTWLSIDWKTGKKTSISSFDPSEKTCPISFSNALFIGRTEYSVMMFDGSGNNRQWNVTFYDYSSLAISNEEMSQYEFVHLGGSSTGRVKTLLRTSGEVLWEKDYGSPLVAMYMRRGQDIVSLPFTSFADSSLEALTFDQPKEKFLPTLYIGEHKHGLYALPSLAGRDLPLLPPKEPPRRLLIEGPHDVKDQLIILGHYQLPDLSKTQLQIAGRNDPVIGINSSSVNVTRRQSLKPETVHSVQGSEPIQNFESKILSLAVGFLTVVVFVMFLHFRAQVRDIQSSRGSSGSSSGSVAVETQYGIISIGKISFNTQHILGKGCEGTFVFRGEFDGRCVAVKRLLPDCFTVADREVCLLRESDAHPNVVRYFCMEQDSQFRYIALELCSATVQDYVEKGLHKSEIDPRDVLRQASSGLGHLHSLNIVHRDIKPHNILLTPTSGASIRVMISDFGLCKKLQNGKASFSKRSGVTGTEGWIAPEMIESNGRTMCAVDIFSFGCVFYYVLTNGRHPFGEPLRRQANILTGEYKLSELKDKLWKSLICQMISPNPHDRPGMMVILKHPTFWEKSLVLTFLQDISDRVEKEDGSSPILSALEMGGEQVCCGDWRMAVDTEVASDLRKYRSYRGDSVRDLLRALRNKKHHFRELSEEAQKLLGFNAESFLNYWLAHFPILLYHTWVSMQILQEEPAFSIYYDSAFKFPCFKSSTLPDWILSPEPVKEKGRKVKKSPTHEAVSNEEVKKEIWIKSGTETGAWRPKNFKGRLRKKEKKSETNDNFVWELPTS